MNATLEPMGSVDGDPHTVCTGGSVLDLALSARPLRVFGDVVGGDFERIDDSPG